VIYWCSSSEIMNSVNHDFELSHIKRS
jgi:hypothetical protein